VVIQCDEFITYSLPTFSLSRFLSLQSLSSSSNSVFVIVSVFVVNQCDEFITYSLQSLSSPSVLVFVIVSVFVVIQCDEFITLQSSPLVSGCVVIPCDEFITYSLPTFSLCRSLSLQSLSSPSVLVFVIVSFFVVIQL
jgi:hypothetical protein